jgi:SAM-dependent methyltransferase
MFIQLVESTLEAIEASPAINSREDALQALRQLGLEDFAYVLMTMPNPQFPRLSSLLPRMASEDLQRRWTGATGIVLLRQTSAFVRSVAYHYARFTGGSLEGRSILDFGCGYGRIARWMYYFSDPSKVIGLDPWERALEVCRQDGLGPQFMQSSYLPTSLPVGDTRFDLIYAFSVFTHLSERATRAALATLTNYLNQNGLLAITIRPVEYWEHETLARTKGLVEHQIALHNEKGFSFLPHDHDRERPRIDGEMTYGDTSFTLEWFAQTFPFLSIKGVDRSLDDPVQFYLFVQRACGIGSS